MMEKIKYIITCVYTIFKFIEDLVEVNKFADEHNLHEAPILITDEGDILNFSGAIKYLG